jgi:NAD(P)-dependent dehydrogenase (short-subunit alcohol dehydrogenase family)
MKNTVIVGGSKGIGLEITKQLYNNNKVYVLSRTAEDLAGLNITHIPFDVTVDQLDLDVLPEVIDQFVYCPGSINLKLISNLKQDSFQSDMEINFFAMVHLFQAILPRLKKSSQASILFFSTVAVSIGMPFHASIAAAKGAVEGFTRSIAAELAPGIRVNAIAPSLTQTSLADKFLNNDRKLDAAKSRNPLQQIGDPKKIAATAVHLLSDDASWVTGQIIHIDGGMSTLKNS